MAEDAFANESESYVQKALRRQKELAFDAGHYPQSSPKKRLLSERNSVASSKARARRRSRFATIGEESKDGLATSKIGTGPSRFDPQPLERVLGGLVDNLGWSTVLSVASIAARWPSIVGPSVAQHCVVETFEDNVLVVRTSSTAWANQMRILLPTLEAQIAQTFGENAVKRVIIRGPQAPSWRKGKLHVPGRGPRDTYG